MNHKLLCLLPPSSASYMSTTSLHMSEPPRPCLSKMLDLSCLSDILISNPVHSGHSHWSYPWQLQFSLWLMLVPPSLKTILAHRESSLASSVSPLWTRRGSEQIFDVIPPPPWTQLSLLQTPHHFLLVLIYVSCTSQTCLWHFLFPHACLGVFSQSHKDTVQLLRTISTLQHSKQLSHLWGSVWA